MVSLSASPACKVFANLLDGCEITGSTTIPAGQSNIELKLMVHPDAREIIDRTITVCADGHGFRQQLGFQLTIRPIMYILPDGWRKSTGLQTQINAKEYDGRVYYSAIDIPRGNIPVRFLLILPSHREEPPPFYIMEDKVWIGLFRAFADTHPQDLHNAGWTKYAQYGEELPAVVNAEEAARFARWLGGEVPTAKQWDKASGRFEKEHGEGPFLGAKNILRPKDIAVNNLDRPMPRGTAIKDRSPFGCRDMSGNVQEWTSSPMGTDPGRRSDDLNAEESLYLRGTGYHSSEPFLYANIGTNDEASSPPNQSKSNIGFRVILELRDKSSLP
jgi:formylglycine-generating enzyme required for sulfatase activity